MTVSPIPVLTGPTGVGKTALSLELAHRLDAEVISVDSRQVYREMDIGTAKPSPEERREVPHHLIDERDADDPISAGGYAEEVWKRIGDIRSRGRTPLLVGGSTLYLRAITEGIADVPPADDAVRRALNERLVVEGAAALFDELVAVDPRAAGTMDPTKSQRIVRALEVYHSTGRPLSSFHDEHVSPPCTFTVAVLTRERSQLYARIDRRVAEMMGAGLLNEVQTLYQRYGRDAAPLRTIGYREIIDVIEGTHDLERAVELIKRNTRRYAKRQLTWFRGSEAYTWFDAASTGVDDLFTLYRPSPPPG